MQLSNSVQGEASHSSMVKGANTSGVVAFSSATASSNWAGAGAEG